MPHEAASSPADQQATWRQLGEQPGRMYVVSNRAKRVTALTSLDLFLPSCLLVRSPSRNPQRSLAHSAAHRSSHGGPFSEPLCTILLCRSAAASSLAKYKTAQQAPRFCSFPRWEARGRRRVRSPHRRWV